MRLIDADGLNGTLIPNCPIEEGGIPLKDFATHQKILKLYPTIDAVPVVRCKDCKRMRELDGHLVCAHALPTKPLIQYFEMGRDILAVVEPDEFCSRGERKDKEE